MPRYVMIAQSAPKPGREEPFNAWYDATHVKDICSLPGVLSARRLEATPIAMPVAGARYLALYEIETDDIGALMAEMGRRVAAGEQSSSEDMDREAAVLWIYADMAD